MMMFKIKFTKSEPVMESWNPKDYVRIVRQLK